MMKPILLKVQISEQSGGSQSGQGAFEVRIEAEDGRISKGQSQLPFPSSCRKTLMGALEAETWDNPSSNLFNSDELKWMETQKWLSQDKQKFDPDLLKTIGKAIYEALFPKDGDVRKLLESILTNREQNRAVHLQLRIDAKSPVASDTESIRLSDYPWELAYDDERDFGKFLVSDNVHFSRFINYNAPATKLPKIQKLNVLLVSSVAYVGKYQKESHEERSKQRSQQEDSFYQESKAIRETLDAQKNIHLFQTERATLSCLRDYLRSNRAPNLLHFHGHGAFGRQCSNCQKFFDDLKLTVCDNDRCKAPLPKEPQGYLLFESEDDKFVADYVSAETLGSQLKAISAGDENTPPGGIIVVVLSACRSGLAVMNESVFNGCAQNLIGNGFPAVVAMQYDVLVDQAAIFAKEFYSLLGQRYSLAQAVNIARVAIMRGKGARQWYRPVLYLRWRDNEGGQLFDPEVVQMVEGAIASPPASEVAPISFDDSKKSSESNNSVIEPIDLKSILRPGSDERDELLEIISQSSKLQNADNRRNFLINSGLEDFISDLNLSANPSDFADEVVIKLLNAEKLYLLLKNLLKRDKFLTPENKRFLISLNIK